MRKVTSRKHPVISTQPHALRQAAMAATLAASFGLAGTVMASDTTATGNTASTTTDSTPQSTGQTQTQSLPAMQVQGYRSADYKVDKASSPKFTESLVDTPQTIQVINKDLFLQQGATTLTEALRNVPGVGTFYAGENGSTSTGDEIYMRGFDTSSSIFVDGVRDQATISRDIFNIEQVEVTQGPDGTEYGRTAPTGAVNMVTKQPQLKDGVSGSVNGGSGDRKRATVDWNQVIGSNSAFRLNVMDQKSGVAGRDDVRNTRWAVAPTLAFGINTPTRVYFDFLHVDQNNVPDGGIPTIGLPGFTTPDTTRPYLSNAPKVDPSNFYGTDYDHDHVKQDMFTTIVEHDFSSDLTLRDTFRYDRTHQNYLLTSFTTTSTTLLTPDPSDPDTWTLARSLPTFKDQIDRIITNQSNLSANFDTGGITHHLSAGIELTQEEIGTEGMAALNGSTLPAANLYDPDPNVSGFIYGLNGANSQGKTNTASAYAFDTLLFGDHWSINTGLRMDHYTTDFDSTVVCGARGAPVCGNLATGSIVPGVNDRSTGNLLNYKLGVVYKPNSNGSIYANFAVSAEPPGGSSLALSSSANSADNPIFNPERARTFEVGSKWQLVDSRLMLTGALYQTTVTDDVVEGDDGLYYQIGRKRVQGVELTAIGQITDNWAVNAGFTTMNTEVSQGPAVSEDGTSDLDYTPNKAFTSWTTYRFANGLTIGGGARYNGEMKRGSDTAVGTPAFVDAYWVFDAMATYSISKHIDLQLNVYNLFNKSYVSSINKSGYRYIPGVPRSAMGTINFRF